MSLWFTESEEDAIQYGYKVQNSLFRKKSPFQEIEIYENPIYGRMMVIDGFVMTTEHDEFVYHELISHVPVCLHKNPQRVLVIGGGDGGTVTQLVKHQCIEKIILCEIDQIVVESAKEFLPKISQGLSDSRVDIKIGDGIAYIKELKDELDIVIVDSTDPIGPGEVLFTNDFYKGVAKALRPGGVMVAQTESPWQSQYFLEKIFGNISTAFKHLNPYTASVPTYPRGYWSWTLASQEPISPIDFSTERLDAVESDTKFLDKENFEALFKVPKFFRKKLQRYVKE